MRFQLQNSRIKRLLEFGKLFKCSFRRYDTENEPSQSRICPSGVINHRFCVSDTKHKTFEYLHSSSQAVTQQRIVGNVELVLLSLRVNEDCTKKKK